MSLCGRKNIIRTAVVPTQTWLLRCSWCTCNIIYTYGSDLIKNSHYKTSWTVYEFTTYDRNNIEISHKLFVTYHCVTYTRNIMLCTYIMYMHELYHPTAHNGPTTHQCINIAYTVRRALVRLGVGVGGGGPRRKSEFAQRICNNYIITPNSTYFFQTFLLCAHSHTLFDERLPFGTSPTSFPARHIIMFVRRRRRTTFQQLLLFSRYRRRRAVKPRDGR